MVHLVQVLRESNAQKSKEGAGTTNPDATRVWPASLATRAGLNYRYTFEDPVGTGYYTGHRDMQDADLFVLFVLRVLISWTLASSVR